MEKREGRLEREKREIKQKKEKQAVILHLNSWVLRVSGSWNNRSEASGDKEWHTDGSECICPTPRNKGSEDGLVVII